MGLIKDLFFVSTRNESLGLCMSGGGALGFAHIGVIQALEDHDIFPEHIVGSSMGAIIGTLYAAGYSPAEMMQLIKDDKLYKITKLMTFTPFFLKSGLTNHSLLRSLIKELIPHNSFTHLKRKMHICVSNLNTAEWEIVSEGDDLDKWVAASASIPGVFEAIKHNDVYYVDGGLLNNFPAQGIEEYCQTIIGVDVIPHIAPLELSKLIDTLAVSVRSMQHQNSKEGRDMCRFVIESKAIEKYHEFSFDAYQDIYQYGYSATVKFIVQNPDILKSKKLKA
jgi:NTE family protein